MIFTSWAFRFRPASQASQRDISSTEEPAGRKPSRALDGQKLACRQAIVNGLGSWLKANIASLPEGRPKPECRIEMSEKSPLHVVLNVEVLPTPNFTSFLMARQQVSVDLDKVVEEALRKKLPKLVKAQAGRRILML